MFAWARVLAAGFVLLAFSCSTTRAVDTAEIKPAPSAEEIAGWIKDLDSDKFAARDQASGKLADAGEAAIDAVTQAAISDSREVSTRAIEILRGLMQSGEKSTQGKAKAALEKLAAGQDDAAARRAAQALKPPTPAVPNAVPRRMGIQIAGAPGARTIRVQNINGRRTIEINENGKKTEIIDDPQQGIDMSITEKVDGKEKTQKIAAKNLEELKKNHPEAAKVLEQFQGNNVAGGVIQIQVQANGFPGAPPMIVPGPRFLPPGFLPNGVQPQQVAEPVAETRKILAEATEQLKKQAAETAGQREALDKSIERIQSADKKLAEAEAKLGK